MSPTTDNFIHSLVEMSKAFEELPNVQTELKSANAKIEAVERHAQALEENINRYKAQIEELQQAKRSVEAERDDAELRFLELDEKAHKALAALGNIMANVNDATRDLTPPTPPQPEEPKHEPATETGYVADAQQPQEHTTSGWNPNIEPMQGQSEPHPMTHTGEGGTNASSSSAEVPKSDANPPTPTASSTDGDGHSPSTATPTPTAQPIDGASSQAQPATQPYANKRYYDHPTYLTRDAWHAGGGTNADYDWRPGRSVGF